MEKKSRRPEAGRRFSTKPTPEYVSEIYGNHVALEAKNKIKDLEKSFEELDQEEKRLQSRFDEIDLEYAGALSDRRSQLETEMERLNQEMSGLVTKGDEIRQEIKRLNLVIRKELSTYDDLEEEVGWKAAS